MPVSNIVINKVTVIYLNYCFEKMLSLTLIISVLSLFALQAFHIIGIFLFFILTY